MIEKKKFFFTVQLLRSKNDTSGGKAPEKINLGNNCRPNAYARADRDHNLVYLSLCKIVLSQIDLSDVDTHFLRYCLNVATLRGKCEYAEES